MYRISSYIPAPTLTRIAGMAYARGSWLADGPPCAVNEDGYCPLGQACQDHAWVKLPMRPTADLVARVFGPHARRPAVEFMQAWDRGWITDLRAALGVAE